MKRINAVLCLVAFLAGCAVDRFTLVDARTGRESGPFTYQTGASLTIGNETYQIRKVGTREQAAEQYLKMTIIPEVQMCPNLYDAVSSCGSFLIDYGPTNTTWRSVMPTIQIGRLYGDDTNDIDVITIEAARNISVFDLLNTICRKGNLRYQIQGNVVFVEHK